MTSYTADFIFDGNQFLSSGSSIEVNSWGEIISLNDPQSHHKYHLRGLLMPGMVNAHCHLELSHLKGKIPKHLGLVNFLSAIMKERRTDLDEEMKSCMIHAEKDMLNNGIVAVGDICNTGHTIELKKSCRLHYHTFVELIGLNPDKASLIVENGLQLRKQFESASLALHAPYSITPELIRLTDENNRSAVLSIHHQESVEEIKLFAHEHSGFTSFLGKITGHPYSYPFSQHHSTEATVLSLHHSDPILLVHNTFSKDKDLQILKGLEKEIYLCACPGANLYIENALPDIPLWLEKGLPVVIGTDSLASNDALCLLTEILILHRYFPEVDLKAWLHAATLQGARALSLDHIIGSFDIQKNPGIIQIENWEELLTGKASKAKIIRWN